MRTVLVVASAFIAAVYIRVITPAIIVFAIAQRWDMKGLLEGALKF